jgi:hypothetical protein
MGRSTSPFAPRLISYFSSPLCGGPDAQVALSECLAQSRASFRRGSDIREREAKMSPGRMLMQPEVANQIGKGLPRDSSLAAALTRRLNLAPKASDERFKDDRLAATDRGRSWLTALLLCDGTADPFEFRCFDHKDRIFAEER